MNKIFLDGYNHSNGFFFSRRKKTEKKCTLTFLSLFKLEESADELDVEVTVGAPALAVDTKGTLATAATVPLDVVVGTPALDVAVPIGTPALEET